MPDKQTDPHAKALRLAMIRKQLNLNQQKFGDLIGIAQTNITAYETGKRGIGKNLEFKILHKLNVNPTWWETGEGEMFSSPTTSNSAKPVDGKTLNYENLTFISTKSRVNFMESLSVTAEFETFEALKLDPSESYAGQIIFEVDGDSMEPYYCDGSKIRCKEVPSDDWEFLLSGVYAVAYGNFFAIKRVKNSPVNGILALHSDNSNTSGTTEIPLSKIRKVWRALRIIDAPIR